MEFLRKISQFVHRHFVPAPHNAYRPRSLSRDVLVTAVALTCVVEGFLIATLFIQSKPGDFTAAVIESAIITQTNNERAANGAGQLRLDPVLARAAQAKADDMAKKSYFSHTGPEGEQPWKWFSESGYDYAYAGENLAIRFYDSSDVVDAWMNSPGHRQNILKSNYQDIGIGIASGIYQGEQTTFVVQFFGTTKAALGMKPSAPISAQSDSSEPKVSALPEVKDASTEPLADNSAETPATVPAEAKKTDTAAAGVPVVNGPVSAIDIVHATPASKTNIPSSIAKYISSPRTIALALLGAIMAFLIIAIGFAMLVRIHLRPTDLALNGVAVAVFTLLIFAFNVHFMSGASLDTEPSAVIESMSSSL